MTMWKDKINDNGSAVAPTNSANSADGPNKHQELVINVKSLERLEAVFNAARTLNREIGARYGDKRRDYNKECGHPETSELTADYFQKLYERNEIAARVIEVWPKECWKVSPIVYDDESEETVSEFEKSLDSLIKGLSGINGQSYAKSGKNNALWWAVRRWHIATRIGSFGVMYIGMDDKDPKYPATGWKVEDSLDSQRYYSDGATSDLYGDFYGPSQYAVAQPGTAAGSVNNPLQTSQPAGQSPTQEGQSQPAGGGAEAPSFKPRVNVRYLCVYAETQVKIKYREKDKSHPRYGKPVMYEITPSKFEGNSSVGGLANYDEVEGTVDVHWSRIVHAVDNPLLNEVQCLPACQQMVNRILDAAKLYGGSAEMYWLGALPAIIFKTDPSLGGDVDVNLTSLKNEVEKLMNGLQRYARLNGFDAQSLAPTVVDPTPQIDKQLEAICIKLEMPTRVFKGSERGQLASEQDDENWDERVSGVQNNHVTPTYIEPLISRFIELGALPEPKNGGFITFWPSMDSLSTKEKANIANTLVSVLAAYTQSEAAKIMPPLYLLTNVFGGLFTRIEAENILEEAKKYSAELAKERQAQQELDMQNQLTMEKEKSKLAQEVAASMPAPQGQQARKTQQTPTSQDKGGGTRSNK